MMPRRPAPGVLFGVFLSLLLSGCRTGPSDEEGRRLLLEALLSQGTLDEETHTWRGRITFSEERAAEAAIPESILLAVTDQGAPLRVPGDLEGGDIVQLRAYAPPGTTDCVDRGFDGTYEKISDRIPIGPHLPAREEGIPPGDESPTCDHLFRLSWLELSQGRVFAPL